MLCIECVCEQEAKDDKTKRPGKSLPSKIRLSGADRWNRRADVQASQLLAPQPAGEATLDIQPCPSLLGHGLDCCLKAA